jgi:hypothetical protein
MTWITNSLGLPRHLGRGATTIASLVAVFVVALMIPIPAMPDAGRAGVRAEVADRLPGWSVERIETSWEGTYSVVTSCAGRELAFQFVPGHGLPRDDAWIQPHNSFARSRLSRTSDHSRYLLWRGDRLVPPSVSCSEKLARDDSSEVFARGRD